MTNFIIIGNNSNPLKANGKVLQAINEFINNVAGEEGVSIQINSINIELIA